MKVDKLTRLRLRWQVNYRARTWAAGFRRGWETLATKARLGARGTVRAIRKAWDAAGYYIALGLLLILLGGAAYAYRQRPRALPQTALPTPEPLEAVWRSDVRWPEPTPAPTPEPFALARPVPGEVLRPYDRENLVWSETLRQWQTHDGVDFAAELGETVAAAEAGEISAAYRDPLLGFVIEIRHENGWITRYASLSTLNYVSVGQTVRKGETISAVGAACAAEAEMGSHLHFELWIDVAPVAPEFVGENE